MRRRRRDWSWSRDGRRAAGRRGGGGGRGRPGGTAFGGTHAYDGGEGGEPFARGWGDGGGDGGALDAGPDVWVALLLDRGVVEGAVGGVVGDGGDSVEGGSDGGEGGEGVLLQTRRVQ